MVHKIGLSPISFLTKNPWQCAKCRDKQAKYDQSKESVTMARSVWHATWCHHTSSLTSHCLQSSLLFKLHLCYICA